MTNSATPDRLYFVFDVESVGLQGQAFSVGWVVIDASGKEIASGLHACESIKAEGQYESREWVELYVPRVKTNAEDPAAVRAAFWTDWLMWHDKATLVADVPFPVESRFLLECLYDKAKDRENDCRPNYERESPYPLIDVASVRLAAGLDPLATVDRLPNELPKHNPLADARQSARLLIEALTTARGR